MIRRLLSFIKSQRWPIIAVLLLAPLILTVPYWQPQLGQTLKTAITKQPERFSELYFASPDQLPKQLIPGQNTAFDFVIVNHEAATYDYRYQVILIQNGAPITHAEEQITLRDGQSHAQRVTLPPQEVDKKLQVIIRLPDKNQEIRFRTEVGA